MPVNFFNDGASDILWDVGVMAWEEPWPIIVLDYLKVELGGEVDFFSNNFAKFFGERSYSNSTFFIYSSTLVILAMVFEGDSGAETNLDVNDDFGEFFTYLVSLGLNEPIFEEVSKSFLE